MMIGLHCLDLFFCVSSKQHNEPVNLPGIDEIHRTLSFHFLQLDYEVSTLLIFISDICLFLLSFFFKQQMVTEHFRVSVICA